MKVLYIHHNGTMGGASRSLYYLVKGFPKNSIEPIFITPKGKVKNLFEDLSKEVYSVDASGLPFQGSVIGVKWMRLRLLYGYRFYKAEKQVISLIKEINPDIVHINDIGFNRIAKAAKEMGYPVVNHARVVFNPDLPDILQKTVDIANKYIDRVICISGSVRHQFSEIKRIDTIYNPIQVNAKDINVEKKKERKEKITCLYLANLMVYKGIFDLIEAAKILKDRDDIKFVIAGSNIRSKAFYQSFFGKMLNFLGLDPDIEARLKSIIEENSMTNVELLGHVSDIDTLLKETDVLLAPMHLDSPSRAVFEAGIYKCPTIISFRNKIEDVVQDGVNGLIIEEKKPKQLSNAILKLADDRELLDKLGQNAQQRFLKVNNPKLISLNVLNVYKQILKKQN